MLDIVVLNLGPPAYSSSALPVLKHYAEKHEHHLHIINRVPPLSISVHPSWLKLLCHSYVDSDFLLCWDLDLLPIKTADDIEPFIDRTKFNLAWDSSRRVNWPNQYNSIFRYNCGLLGMPKSESTIYQDLFWSFAPGTRPSYEQYYVNEHLASRNWPVHEIPDKFNVLYPPSSIGTEAFDTAVCKHYTWGILGEKKIKAIKAHSIEYFS